MKIRFLKVKCGDSIFINFSDTNNVTRNIIVDTGNHRKKIYHVFKKEFDEIIARGEKIDLLILTHNHDDHIGGLWKLTTSIDFNLNEQIDRIWLNHSLPIMPNKKKVSISKAFDLKLIFQQANKCPTEPITTMLKPIDIFGVQLTILSPDKLSYEKEVNNYINEENRRKVSRKESDHRFSISHFLQTMHSFKEDDSAVNRSSIAFLLKYKEKKALFLADSHPSVIIHSLNRMGYNKENKLKIDFVKISHHGSKFNTSIELLSILDTQKFVFLTNGKNEHNLPDKEAIVRVIKNPERNNDHRIQIIFNQYDEVLSSLFAVDENPFEKHVFDLIFPSENELLTIDFKN